jgi:hypothetical protein
MLGGALLACSALAAVLLPSVLIRGLAPGAPAVVVPAAVSQPQEIEVRALPLRPRAGASARVTPKPQRRAQPRAAAPSPSFRVRTSPAARTPQQQPQHAPAPEPAVEARVFTSRSLRVVEPPRGRPVLDEKDEPPVQGEDKDEPPRPGGGRHKE